MGGGGTACLQPLNIYTINHKKSNFSLHSEVERTCVYVRMHACTYVCTYVCMYLCMYAYIYICMYACNECINNTSIGFSTHDTVGPTHVHTYTGCLTSWWLIGVLCVWEV